MIHRSLVLDCDCEEDTFPRLDRVIQHWLTAEVLELQKLAATLRYRRREVSNYATFRISNSIAEGLNNKIQVIKCQAYGLRSFKNFHRKVLLVG